MVRSISMFLLIGGLCTGLQYLILVLLVHYNSTDPTLASSIGFVISAVVNYLLNRRMTFQSGAPHRRAAPRFIIVASSGLLLNAVIMLIGTNILNWNYLLVQIVATVIVLFFNYIAHRSWSFSEDGVS